MTLMILMILAFSLLLNVVLINICYGMKVGWKEDTKRFLDINHKVNNEWYEKYNKLLDEYEKLLDEEDDLK